MGICGGEGEIHTTKTGRSRGSTINVKVRKVTWESGTILYVRTAVAWQSVIIELSKHYTVQ
jgi:hypothetical protein